MRNCSDSSTYTEVVHLCRSQTPAPLASPADCMRISKCPTRRRELYTTGLPFLGRHFKVAVFLPKAIGPMYETRFDLRLMQRSWAF